VKPPTDRVKSRQMAVEAVRVYNKVKKAKPVKGKVHIASKSTFLRHDDLFAHLDKRKFPTHHMATIAKILEMQEAAKGQVIFDKTIGDVRIDGVPRAALLSDWIRSSDPVLMALLDQPGAVLLFSLYYKPLQPPQPSDEILHDQ